MMTPRRMMRFLCLLAAGALVAACATARSGADSADEQHSQLSAIHEHMLAAMTRAGEIYHPRITSVALQDPFTVTTTTELWIDAANSRARADITARFSPDNAKTSALVVDGPRWFHTVEYGETLKREATPCRDAESVILSLMLGCHTRDEQSMTVPLTDQTFGGRPAIALVTFAQVVGAKETAAYTDTLFVDAATYLPIALQSGGTLRPHAGVPGSEARVGQFTTFQHEFVPANSVPTERFDPRDIDYVEVDPLTPLLKPSPDFTYYWLGATASGSGLPRLMLRDTFIADAAVRPVLRYRAVLKYRAEADEFSDSLVELQEWRRDEWDFLESQAVLQPAEGRCVTRTDVGIGDRGQATIFSTYGPDSALTDGSVCPTTPPDRYYAIVRTGGAVVRISAPGATAWNSEAGMRTLVEALVSVE